MESNELLIPSQNDESNTKTSLTFDSQPKFDSLLDKLRKGMSELTSKGDDFTKQMFQMYNTLEDIVISSKMNDKQNLDNILKTNNICSDDKTFNLSINSSNIESNNCEINLNNKLSEDLLSTKQNSVNNRINETINTSDFSSPMASDCEQLSNEDLINTKTIDIITNKSIINKKSEKVSKVLEEIDKNNGYINRRNDHMINPLLDTINSLTSCSDSSDECDINKKCYNRRLMNSNRHLKRKTSNYYYSSSDGDSISGYTGSNSLESGYKSDFLSCNTPEIIDESSLSSFGTTADSVEPTISSRSDNISRQISDNDSNNGKESVVKPLNTTSTTMKSFDINNSHNNDSNKNSVRNHKHKNDNISAQTSSQSITTNSATNKKTVGMFSEKIANRLKGFNNDSQLEHLLKLRKSLLKALKRCEQISSPVNSRDGSPVTVISSRSSSPASTVVKSPLTSNTNNYSSRRKREDNSCCDKMKSKLVSSPLTLRPDDNSLNNCCVASNNSSLINSTSNTMNSNFNNNSNSSSNKSVRFNSSVKINPLNSLQHNNDCSNYSANYNAVNKSILKDSFCEKLRSTINAGEFASDCSLEGEIDSLLYGRTGGYYYSPQLEGSGHLDDSPSSTYVTMIEDKYRTFSANSSASKQSSATSSKKTSKDYSSLKTGFASTLSSVSALSKPHESDLDLITTSELRINATLSTTMSRPKSNAYSIYGNGLTIANKTNRKSTKSHFKEMAKCMLEILDDLQVPQNNQITNERQTIFDESSQLQNSLLLKKPETESIDLLMKELSRGQSDNSDISDISSSISYRTLPEHHIYEEILYDCLESGPQQCKYLHYSPRRQITSISSTNTFSHSSVNSIRLDAPIHQNRSISPDIKHSNRHVGSWGRTSNKPKQRSNLYSLFADEMERRNISRSLEREYCKRRTVDINAGANIQTDSNYGFKASL